MVSLNVQTQLHYLRNFEVLAFQVPYFDIYFSMDCVSDRLRYYNGNDTSKSQVLDFCGDFRPNLPISGSNAMIFQFITTSYESRNGFHITYDADVSSRELTIRSQEAFGKYSYLGSGVSTINLRLLLTHWGRMMHIYHHWFRQWLWYIELWYMCMTSNTYLY